MTTPLFGQTLTQLQALCQAEGLPRYAARQLCDWMYAKRVEDFDAMTNLSLSTRALLKQRYGTVGRRQPVLVQTATDGTRKYLFAVADTPAAEHPVAAPAMPTADTHNHVEAVFIPAQERATLCVSCQRGCKMGCRFCVTGQQGFHGNLSAADILNQIYSIAESQQLTNVVFMGMGEPLDNYDAIRQTLEIITAPWGLAWSPHRLTVSTVGITPMLRRLLDECQCHVAVSLHNPIGDERAQIMPMQRAYPIEQTISLLKQYDWSGQRRISFEYTMMQGINDDRRHAQALVRLLRGLHCRVNLIRFHTSEGMPYRSSDEATMNRFRDQLNAAGLTCTIRASRGEDIMAACGLLAGQHKENPVAEIANLKRTV